VLLLSGPVFAETIPATPLPTIGTQYPTCAQVASGSVVNGYGQIFMRLPSVAHCGGSYPAGFTMVTYCENAAGSACSHDAMGWTSGAAYSCPSGQNWTLSGANCTRPDCVAPQVRDSSTGQCIASPCQSGESVTGGFFAGWRVGLGANQIIGSDGGAFTFNPHRCQNGCSVNVTVSDCTSAAGYVDTPVPITCTGTGIKTGATCTSDNTGAPSTTPTVPSHRPKCNAGEGVLTSSSGTVACVPSGTPSSTPVVRTEKQTQQFPDGSAKTTETTYTKDPVSQVQDTQQTITNSPATGGGAGQAGPVGTTSGSTSVEPSSPTDKEASDFCKANGQLQICKGDMNKEETQKQVRDYIKSLTDPGTTPFTELGEAKQSTKSDDDLKEQTDKFQAAAEGTFSPNSAARNSWQSAMDSGWFEPVTRQGCQPYSATIGGRTWNLDICPTAEKISVISEYVIWFMLVVGSFVMLTGGAFTRNT